MSKRSKEYDRRYYREHRERRLAQCAEYVAKNRDKRRAYNAAYYRAHQEKYNSPTKEQRDERNAKRRERYQKDDAYREREKAKVREYNQRNRHAKRAYSLRQFGITIADYERLVTKQRSRCAICREAKIGDSLGRRLYVDHCHKSGKVRGLLCSSCNFGLGKFRDDQELLRRAILYLRRNCGKKGVD